EISPLFAEPGSALFGFLRTVGKFLVSGLLLTAARLPFFLFLPAFFLRTGLGFGRSFFLSILLGLGGSFLRGFLLRGLALFLGDVCLVEHAVVIRAERHHQDEGQNKVKEASHGWKGVTWDPGSVVAARVGFGQCLL